MVASRWSGLGFVGAWLCLLPVAPAPTSGPQAPERPLACEPAAVVQRAVIHLGSAGEWLDSAVATEEYVQQATGLTEPDRPALPPIGIREDLQVPPPASMPSRPSSSRRHRAAFLYVRQRDDAAWVGFRDVRAVNGRPADAAGAPPARVAQAIDDTAMAYWRRRSAEGARHHLGPIVRRLNVPTAALAVLRPANRARFVFAAGPAAEPGRCVITFQEAGESTVLRSGIDDDVPASGSLVIDAASGRVVGSELMGANRASGVASKTAVRYERDLGLDRLVPREMTEEFVNRFGERVRGVATYSNYRKLEVTARIPP